MWNKLKKQFSALSLAGKAAFIGAALISGTVFAAAIKPSSPNPEPKPTIQTEVSMPNSNKPQTEVKTITETVDIAFETEQTTDSSLEKGKTKTVQEGKKGRKEIKYEVTYENGVEVSRKKISETSTESPVNEIVATGTYVAATVPPKSKCDPNYSGACVPIASDVDCVGGTGNGPAYVQGPVYVIGQDIYGLDKDKDGIGCN